MQFLKIIPIFSLLYFLAFTSGCKKEIKQENKIEQGQQQINPSTSNANQAIRLTSSPGTSKYGFLIFRTVSELEEYHTFLLNNTHGQVQEFLRSIGFTSLGTMKYNEEYFDAPISENQAIDYVFDINKIVQIQEVIMKPIEEIDCSVKWQFLLTMVPNNLTDRSYGYLKNGSYDETTMNKFATNSSSDASSMFDFIQQTPFGHEETNANLCPIETSRRPFWGYDPPPPCKFDHNEFNPATGNNDLPVYLRCKKGAHYIFWIKDSGPSDCYYAYGCGD
jgi:hypothetical protein